ncbi:hypothetical protein UY3_00070 [Chelonia mydas]|uniref:Uncharacterized protein n=1 Tax=Chelonia mydas TaxID=8469 RepID=M7C321_CHEMY|nr:hypothetical protein UY3_00070 [Chelonia mydas]
MHRISSCPQKRSLSRPSPVEEFFGAALGLWGPPSRDFHPGHLQVPAIFSEIEFDSQFSESALGSNIQENANAMDAEAIQTEMTHDPHAQGTTERGETVEIPRREAMENQVGSDRGKLCGESVVEPETSFACCSRIRAELVVSNPTTDRALGWDPVEREGLGPPTQAATHPGVATQLINTIDSGHQAALP